MLTIPFASETSLCPLIFGISSSQHCLPSCLLPTHTPSSHDFDFCLYKMMTPQYLPRTCYLPELLTPASLLGPQYLAVLPDPVSWFNPHSFPLSCHHPLITLSPPKPKPWHHLNLTVLSTSHSTLKLIN